jgi:ankyrin repeat protein
MQTNMYHPYKSELEWICGRGNLKRVQELITAGEDPSRDNDRPLIAACEKGRNDVVCFLLTFPKVDPTGCISLAIECDDEDLVKLLLKDGRDDPAMYDSIITDACKNKEIVKLLLDDGRADPSVYHNEAIGMACQLGCMETVQLLLTDPRVNPADDNNNAIYWACHNGHFEITQLLFNHQKVNPTGQDHIKFKHGEMVKLNVNGCQVFYLKHKMITKITHDLEHLAKEEYIRWQYRIGGDKHSSACSSLNNL